MLTASILFVLLAGISAIGRDQATGAFGRLTCNQKPAAGVLVKLYDNDRTDPDDLLAETQTGEDGSFRLEGWTSEVSTIDPKLNIYHDCNDGIKPCQIKFTLNIPDQYISPGRQAQKFFDSGVLPLEAEYPGQTRDCIHLKRVNAKVGEESN
ncbi:Protein CBR-TTR-6 [Aphelenchoides bicaudatus]|nr:Protein CBR-TTR-6 [Aphelenchoides bicaudatus]